MRKYRLVLPESIAKEKEREKERKRKKAAKEAEKRRQAKKLQREREKQKEKERKKKEKEKEKERLLHQKEKERLSEERRIARMERKKIAYKAKRKKYLEEHKEEIKEHKRKMQEKRNEAKLTRAVEKTLAAEEAKKEAKKKEAEKTAKIKRKARNKRYYNKLRKKANKSARNKRYYDKHKRPLVLQKRIENGDTPGTFMVAIAQDNLIRRTLYKQSWLNDAIERYNTILSKNHEDSMCPSEEITSSLKPTAKTTRELVLLKHINPEVEDNVSVFRDDCGKSVTVKTNKDEWVILKKDVWYVEEKFIIPNVNPRTAKKDMKWICENFIENNLSINNLKKIFMWNNYVIINGDEDFEFVIGRTVNTAINLYMKLFKKYENTDYVYFIGKLDSSLVPALIEKIIEKTGWENLTRAKRTYHNKGVSSVNEITKSIPTKSSSTVSTSVSSSEECL